MVWIWRSAVGGHQIAVEVAPGRDTRGWNSMCCVVFGGCCCRCCLRGGSCVIFEIAGYPTVSNKPTGWAHRWWNQKEYMMFRSCNYWLRSPSTTGCIVGHHSGAFNPYERRWESSSNILKPPTISLSSDFPIRPISIPCYPMCLSTISIHYPWYITISACYSQPRYISGAWHIQASTYWDDLGAGRWWLLLEVGPHLI